MRFLPFFALFLLVACQNDADGPAVQQIPTDGSISSIIRSPVTAEGVDTVNVAKMVFSESVYDFGSVQQGKSVEHVYEFTNTGNRPLLISNARSTCGCTVPKWPETPIAPGASGKITVRLDTKDLEGMQNKPVQVTANTYPNITEVRLVGRVEM